jgi:AraC-like DNA-binding protein
MPINQQQTMTASAVRPLLRFIESYDISLNDILQDTLLDETKLSNDRIPIACFDQLLNNVARLTQSDNIGFITGQALELQSFSLLGFLLSRSETGRDALVTLRRYYMLLSDSPSPEIFITKNEIKVIYHISNGNDLAMRARAELIATGIHSLGRSLGGNLYQPLKMGFKHNKPKYHAQLSEFFAVDITYNQAECWISFAAEHIDQPLQYSNPNLFYALRKQAENLLEGHHKLDSSSAKVRYVLQQWPNQHTANKEAVAELLNTSPRTLTRRLQEEKTQFSHLLRDVRMEKAQIKLKSQLVDMQELAHDLGFADRRGFERAFKQWSGTTPSAYHKQWKVSLSPLEEA